MGVLSEWTDKDGIKFRIVRQGEILLLQCCVPGGLWRGATMEDACLRILDYEIAISGFKPCDSE